MFKECFIEHFGKLVGSTKPSETQFSGNLIAALRLLRLKVTLLMCIRKPEFIKKYKIEMLYWYFRKSVFGTMCLLFAMLFIQSYD